MYLLLSLEYYFWLLVKMCAGKPRMPLLKAGLLDFYPFLDHGFVTFSGNDHLHSLNLIYRFSEVSSRMISWHLKFELEIQLKSIYPSLQKSCGGTWASFLRVQSNLDYVDLDYTDFSIVRTFSLVQILSWIFISHDQDPFFKTTALKSEVKASLFRFQKVKAALARVVTNEEHSNEVWMAKSCLVAKWDFMPYWLVQRGM